MSKTGKSGKSSRQADKTVLFYTCLKKCISQENICELCALYKDSMESTLCKDALVFAPVKPLYYGQFHNTTPPESWAA